MPNQIIQKPSRLIQNLLRGKQNSIVSCVAFNKIDKQEEAIIDDSSANTEFYNNRGISYLQELHFNQRDKKRPQQIKQKLLRLVLQDQRKLLHKLGRNEDAKLSKLIKNDDAYYKRARINQPFLQGYFYRLDGLQEAVLQLGLESFTYIINSQLFEARYPIYLIGNVLHEFGKLQEARLDYSKAIYINSQNADSYYNRVYSIIKLGRKEDDIINHSKTIDLNSKFANAYVNRSQIFFRKIQGNLLNDLCKKKDSLIDYYQATYITKFQQLLTFDPSNWVNTNPSIIWNQYQLLGYSILRFQQREALLTQLQSCHLFYQCLSSNYIRNLLPGQGWVLKPFQFMMQDNYWIDGWFKFTPHISLRTYNNLILQIVQQDKEVFKYNGIIPLKIILNYDKNNLNNNGITVKPLFTQNLYGMTANLISQNYKSLITHINN